MPVISLQHELVGWAELFHGTPQEVRDFYGKRLHPIVYYPVYAEIDLQTIKDNLPDMKEGTFAAVSPSKPVDHCAVYSCRGVEVEWDTEAGPITLRGLNKSKIAGADEVVKLDDVRG